MIPKVAIKNTIMKKIFYILIIFGFYISCKAQTVPLKNKFDDNLINNAYYKDIDNDLIKFIGTWQYSNGNEKFKISLKKENNNLVNSTLRNLNYTEDVLYGEYQYINTNNIEVINTLANIDAYTDISQHLIYGNLLTDRRGYPQCFECDPNEIRVSLLIEDPERSYMNYQMMVRHLPGDASGSPERIQIIIRKNGMVALPEGAPGDDRIPVGDIILTKVD